jgi:hypothetical protein
VQTRWKKNDLFQDGYHLLQSYMRRDLREQIVGAFKGLYPDNGIWSFIPVSYECKYLKYKFKQFYGLEGLKLGQRPMTILNLFWL